MRSEKNIFDNIYIDLKAELHEKKEQLKKVLEESKNAKFEIEKGQERLDKYKIEAEMEKKKFEKELENAQNPIESENRDNEIKDIFIKTNKERTPSPVYTLFFHIAFIHFILVREKCL